MSKVQHWFAAGFVTTALATPAAAPAAVRIVDIGVLSPIADPGDRSKVRVLVRNSGRRAVRAGAVRFQLDGRTAGSARVGRVQRGATKTVTGTLRFATGLTVGAHSVRACLGGRCRRQAEPVAVAAPLRADSLGTLDVVPRPAEGGFPGVGVIPQEGGSLYAVAADGTLYTLIVPPGALGSSTSVSMTPLASVDGVPFAGGILGGVQLEPSGLEFARPAALVITRDGLRPEAGQVTFGYTGDGADLHLGGWFARLPDFIAGLYQPERSIVLPVEHFSGIGVAPATDLEIARQLRYDALYARDRLAQQLGKVIIDERNRQVIKGAEATDLSSLTAAAMTTFLEQVLLPEAAAASFSDAMYEAAVRDFLGWERQRQLLGGEENGSSDARHIQALERYHDLMDTAWKRVVERAEARCFQGDFSVLARILPLERQRSLTGQDHRVNEFSEVLKRCWQFELRVRSRVEHKATGGDASFGGTVDETYELVATVPLRLAPGSDGVGVLDMSLVGDAPFRYATASHYGEGQVEFGKFGGSCTTRSTGQTRPGHITVREGLPGYGVVSRNLEPGKDPKRARHVLEVAQRIRPFLLLDVGDPQEQIAGCDQTRWERSWLRYWAPVHYPERSIEGRDEQRAYLADPGPWRLVFDKGRYPIVGRLVVDRSEPRYAYRVTELWELVHSPPAGRRAAR